MKHKKQETDWDDVPLVIDLPFAARILGVSYTNLQTKAREGKFPAVKVNAYGWRIGKKELQEFIRTGQSTGVKGETSDGTNKDKQPGNRKRQTRKGNIFRTNGERTYYHRRWQ